MTVLLPTADDLRQALIRHAEAVARDERRSTAETFRAREDSAYTLCVMTGTTRVEDARRVADGLLRRSAGPVRSLRTARGAAAAGTDHAPVADAA
ncbi:DUF5133 domain-containing protein [Streptomyces sp. NPDC049813]|uniref:DUF5133 domain-containing protein n=1 Tax=Streptomyces sp. NPDC049813 TaxID=3365597 RepID=UPI003790D0C8